tara:strand:- start:1027 stop:3417 length:2391 start_codon:yes stop_codon:yes gene_type:complete
MKQSHLLAVFGVFMSSTALTAAPAVAASFGNVGMIRPLTEWQVGEVSANAQTHTPYCVTVNKFEKGYTLAVAKTKAGSHSIAIDFPQSRFETGSRLPITLTHSDGYNLQSEAVAVNARSLVVQLGKEELILSALKSGGRVNVSLPDTEIRMSLAAFDKSAAKLIDCVSNLKMPSVEMRHAQADVPQAIGPDVAAAPVEMVAKTPILTVETAETVEMAEGLPIETSIERPIDTTAKMETTVTAKVKGADLPVANLAPEQKTVELAEVTTTRDEIVWNAPIEEIEVVTTTPVELNRVAPAAGAVPSVKPESVVMAQAETSAAADVVARERATADTDADVNVQASNNPELEVQALEAQEKMRRARIEALSNVSGVTEDNVPVSVIQKELMMQQADLERQARAQAQEAEWIEKRRMALPDNAGAEQDMENRLQQLRQENEALRLSRSESEQRLRLLEQERADMSAGQAAVQTTTDAQVTKIEALSGELTAREAEIARLNQELATLRQEQAARAEVARQEADALTEAKARSEMTAAQELQANPQAAQMELPLETPNADVQALEQRAAEAEAAAMQAQDLADNAEREVEMLTSRLRDTQQEISTLKRVQAATPAVSANANANAQLDTSVANGARVTTSGNMARIAREPVSLQPQNATAIAKPDAPVVQPVSVTTVPEQPQVRAASDTRIDVRDGGENYERATGFIDKLMQEYEPRAGGNMLINAEYETNVTSSLLQLDNLNINSAQGEALYQPNRLRVNRTRVFTNEREVNVEPQFETAPLDENAESITFDGMFTDQNNGGM